MDCLAFLTGEFLRRLVLRTSEKALACVGESKCLGYQDLAEVVGCYESFALLRALIPRKITVHDYRKVARPSRFFSFTL